MKVERKCRIVEMDRLDAGDVPIAGVPPARDLLHPARQLMAAVGAGHPEHREAAPPSEEETTLPPQAPEPEPERVTFKPGKKPPWER